VKVRNVDRGVAAVDWWAKLSSIVWRCTGLGKKLARAKDTTSTAPGPLSRGVLTVFRIHPDWLTLGLDRSRHPDDVYETRSN
jgi:hypothetical protein